MPIIEPFRDERWSNVYAYAREITAENISREEALPDRFWLGCVEIFVQIKYLGQEVASRYYIDPKIDPEWMFSVVLDQLVEEVDTRLKTLNPLIHLDKRVMLCAKTSVACTTANPDLVTCPPCKEEIFNVNRYAEYRFQ